MIRNIKNRAECMWSGCCLPNMVVSQAHSGKPRCVMAFLHLRQPLSLLHLGDDETYKETLLGGDLELIRFW